MEEIGGYVPVGTLWKLERNKRLAVSARDYSTATDPEVKARAMRALGTEYAFLNASGKDGECNLTEQERDALLRVATGAPYKEEPRTDQAAELQARKDASASIFDQEAASWKTRR